MIGKSKRAKAPAPAATTDDAAPPRATPAEGSFVAVAIGSALFVAPAVVQAMIVALFVAAASAAPDPDVVAGLTRLGRSWYLPDRDVPIYVAAALAYAAIVALLAWSRSSRRLDHDPDRGEAGPRAEAGRLALLGVAVAALGGLGLALKRPPGGARLSGAATALLIVPAVAASLWVALVPAGRRTPARDRVGSLLAALAGREEPTRGRRSRAVGRALVAPTAIFLAAALYVPDWQSLAGSSVAGDVAPFHHWDFYVMGPALGFLHGKALGTAVYTQYGVGWPMLLAWGSSFVAPSHGRLYLYAITFCVAYSVALLLALRATTGRTTWAIAAALATVNLLFFCGYDAGSTLFGYPSSTPLRSPTDVLFFLALWGHARTGRRAWAAAAGAAVGLGIVFATDVGQYLAVALAVYLFGLVAATPDHRAQAGRGAPITAAVAVAVAAGIAVAGLALASRGTLLRGEFWRGLIEAPRIYLAGMGSLPISGAGRLPLILFGLATGTYLVALGPLAAAMLARRATPGLAALGALAVYGLLLMLIFVNRSHPYNLCHAAAPACAILTIGGARLLRGVPPRVASVAAWACLLAALAALAINPRFRAHPSVLREALRGPLPRGEWFAPREHVRGISPATAAGPARDLDSVAARMSSLRYEGRSVAVLDPADTMYYLASGCPPADRYSPSLACFIWKEQVARRVDRFLARKSDFVFMKGPESWSEAQWGDALDALHEALEAHYEPCDRVGSFALWRRKGAVFPGGSAPGPSDLDRE